MAGSGVPAFGPGDALAFDPRGCPAPHLPRADHRSPARTSPMAFPWDEAMGAGLGLLRLPPSDFWRLTPRELAAALGAFSPRRPALDRDGLSTLMARFPDAPS